MRGRVRWLVALVCLTAGCHRARPTPAPAVGDVTLPTGGNATPDHHGTADSGAPAGPSTRTDTVSVSTTEVAREAVRIFGDSLTAAPETVAADSVAPTWDIDVRSYETHRRVEHYVNAFTGNGRHKFVEWLNRGGRYDSMIRTKLQAAGLPQDLTYLAMIESGYNPHAYSRAAAVGIWQFMTTTARGTGLRVDWWVDERRDPVRSTDAAIRFIGWLNEQFGSMYLAAAAYNGGPGRIARGLTRYADALSGTSGDDTFFALAEQNYLRAETKDYVPKLIAAALIAKSPRRYGIEVAPEPVYVYDTVRVPPSTPLAAVAQAASRSVEELRILNPHLLRGMTPPRGSFTVRVPPGASAGFDSAFAALETQERTALTRAVAKKTDTKGSMARRAGITVRQLEWYNPKLGVIRKTGRLVAGQVVWLPSPAVVLAAHDVPDPAIERYGSGRGRTHVVRRGESLGLIAKRYRTSVASLKRLNGLKKTVIYPGQVIVVRGSPARSRPARGRATASAKPRQGG